MEMTRKPGIISIIQNDSWAAPALGVFVMSFVMTLIVLAGNQVVGMKATNPVPFIVMTGASFPLAIGVSIYRIRYVQNIFENGFECRAKVINAHIHRSNLRLKLHYIYLSQIQEKTMNQVITGKTKRLIQQQELIVVIDQKNPNHVLLRDAYL